jgi:uncharacterized membrane protein YraQ (UPF0718 family)
MSAIASIGQALFLAAGMIWQVGWSLILGFALSGLIQAVVPKEAMQRALGRNGVREITLATLYGAASSSCSYAAAAMSKTLFKKGAGLIPSLAFLFSSTNLVVELGLILYVLMGWQFTAAEWIGGILLVAIMSIVVKLTYPKKLVEEARQHVDEAFGHNHGDNVVEGATLWDRIRNPETKVLTAQNFAMDVGMLWKDLLIGFVIAGALSAFVPNGVWGSPYFNTFTAPLIAIFTFVCSIGNVPMAAILWGGGISFGGVLSFLYADLIVLPLLDVYRRYYGWKMAAYIGIVLYVTMVAASLIIDRGFTALHLVPQPNTNIRMTLTTFSFNYTFYLNLLFGALAAWLWWLQSQNPMEHACHAHEGAHE